MGLREHMTLYVYVQIPFSWWFQVIRCLLRQSVNSGPHHSHHPVIKYIIAPPNNGQLSWFIVHFHKHDENAPDMRLWKCHCFIAIWPAYNTGVGENVLNNIPVISQGVSDASPWGCCSNVIIVLNYVCVVDVIQVWQLIKW